MMDTAIQAAKDKRNQLVKERDRLSDQITGIDHELTELQNFILKWYELSGEPIPDNENIVRNSYTKHTGPDPILGKPRKKAVNNSKKEDVAAAAREIILERGEPIMRDDLYELLTERGLTIQGQDPYMVLSTMLWRMKDQIVRIDGGGYWPADVKNDEIGYDPAAAKSFDTILNTPTSEVLDPDSEEYQDASENAG